MLPSQTHLRRKRFHAWEYIEHEFPSDVLDFKNEQLPSGFEYLKQDNYFFSEYDMAFPSGISDDSLPNDIPDQLFDGINLCEELWENTLLCQLKKKYDKFCQKDIAAFLKCKLKRDHQIKIRAIEFETFKMTQENQNEISKRKELVDEKIIQVENQLANSIKPPYRDVCKEQLHLNDLQFLELRKYYIEKSLRSSDIQ